MTISDLFLIACGICVGLMYGAMLYGDYLDGEYTPFWQKKKEGVNSGAKFG